MGLWLGLLLVAGAAGLLYWRANAATPDHAWPREVDLAEAAAWRDAGAFVLDVREVDEWEAYHIPGSTLIPLGRLSARLDELPRDRPIVVVCRSGNRSATGRDLLLAAGFDQVTSLAGGLSAWRDLGYPTVAGS